MTGPRTLSKPWHERCGAHHDANEPCPALEHTRDAYPSSVEVVRLPHGGHQVALLINGEAFVMRPSRAAQLAQMLTRCAEQAKHANRRFFRDEEERGSR